MILHRSRYSSSRTSGFSLIEIMIAVVVLATGLLALAALQGALARNSADTKARGAIMAALTSRMNDIRQSPPASGKTWTMSDGWVSAAATQAGASDLQVVEGVSAYSWNGTGYVTTSVASPTSVYVRATLTATWTAADGKDNAGNAGKRSLSLNSDVSSRIYGDGSGYPVPDPTGSASKKPIIRQANPSNTPGVIPLVSGSQATAASNPQPIKLGSSGNKLIGTAFDVLNYVPEGTTAKIIKRFQTEVIKCRCAYGAGGGYSVAGEAQWPAVWDGATYSTYKGSGDPAGKTANAGQNSTYQSSQSPRCTECCRDHHDAAGNLNKDSYYDPEETVTSKYNDDLGSPVSSGPYVAACRVVKVDGIWKTAADMYLRSYGLLETKSSTDGLVQAKSGLPSDAATLAYAGSTTVTGFVKDYLSNYTGSSTTAPVDAQTTQTMFDDPARGLNNPPPPTGITIASPSDTDERYLHGRGLYVDYLSAAARQAVGAAISACSTQTPSKALAECILPVLPFTTVNLTEMAKWLASDATVLTINTTKSLNWNVSQPSGGRTTGIKVGAANNVSAIRTSNSGLAVSDDIPGAVDKNGDLSTLTDSQAFTVGGGSGNPTPIGTFNVSISGGGGSPSVKSTLSTTGCTWSGTYSAYSCPSTSALPQTGTITLSNYFRVQRFAETFAFAAGKCTPTNGNKVFPGGNFTIPAGTQPAGVPKLVNQKITGVSVNGAALTGPWDATRNGGFATEETDIDAGSIPAPASSVPATNPVTLVPAKISVTLTDDTGYVPPTVSSCTFKDGNPDKIVSVVWNETWAN